MYCEAQAMDFGKFGHLNPVPLCEELGEIEVDGYNLCSGCADALEFVVYVGLRLRKDKNAFN